MKNNKTIRELLLEIAPDVPPEQTHASLVFLYQTKEFFSTLGKHPYDFTIAETNALFKEAHDKSMENLKEKFGEN